MSQPDTRGGGGAPPPPLPRQHAVAEESIPVDCLGCRAVAVALGVGGGGYLASRLFEKPRPVGAHRYTLVATSAAMFVAGLYRVIF